MVNSLIVKHAEDILRSVHEIRLPGGFSAPTAIDSSWARCVTQFHLDPSSLYSSPAINPRLLIQRLEQPAEEILLLHRRD